MQKKHTCKQIRTKEYTDKQSKTLSVPNKHNPHTHKYTHHAEKTLNMQHMCKYYIDRHNLYTTTPCFRSAKLDCINFKFKTKEIKQQKINKIKYAGSQNLHDCTKTREDGQK